MTKLSQDQERHITKLQNLKENYDSQLSMLQAEFEAAKEELKNPIREGVVLAQEAGVPTRQIHQRGLGWAQVASMVNFLETKPETLGQRLKRLTQPVTATVGGNNGSANVSYESKPGLKMIEQSLGNYTLTDRAGDEWKFHFLGMALNTPILVDGHDAFTISDDGPEIRDLILAKWPNVANLENKLDK